MRRPAIWFPAIRAGTGADVFTQRLCDGLQARGIRAEIAWLPHRAEYVPWLVEAARPPPWANVCHVNTWLHEKFIPSSLPVVATMHHVVHDGALDAYKSFAQRIYHAAWIRPLESRVLARASTVVAVSHYTARMTQEAFGSRDIRVVHNGIDPQDYPDRGATNPGLPFRLLYVGTWSRRKGVDMLAPIMESLGADFELRYTSGSEHGPRDALPSNCISIGRPGKEALADAYSTSDALLLPSRLEGFGQVAVEAMACGTPVVATNGSALPEVVEDGVTGFLCPQDDVTAFANAIRRMAADQTLWQSLSQAARARVAHEFDALAMVDRYVTIYRSLL